MIINLEEIYYTKGMEGGCNCNFITFGSSHMFNYVLIYTISLFTRKRRRYI